MGVRELALLAVLYVAYSGTRLVADDALAPAVDRAHALVDVEIFLGLNWEHALNRLFVDVDWLGLVGSYWYATAHYVVTAAVLVWLYRRGPATYAPARRALLIATVAGLVLYLLLPMAPPRLTGGYVDVLSLHSAVGWWGGGRLGPARAGRVHQPAGGVPVAARRVGAVGGAGDPQRDAEPRRPGVRVDARGGDGAGGGRHRQPLGARRGRRLAGGRRSLVRRDAPEQTRRSSANLGVSDRSSV